MKLSTKTLWGNVSVGLTMIFGAMLQAQPVAGYSPAKSDDVIGMPALTVYSNRVALQEPSTAAFAMPVSALGFEPLVDIQGRNIGEAQADISIRGGIFENSGFRAGAAPLFDPQTGHYLAEIPIAPAMLTAPEIITGEKNAMFGWNANTGTIAYEWRRIRTAGMASAGGGDYDTWRGELYQGYELPANVMLLGRRLAFDGAAAWARSDGSLPWGESRFNRYNLRAQLAGDTGQTDLFYGYQSKFIAWPNLYTPYANVFETDDLQTSLVMFNHREIIGEGRSGNVADSESDYVSVGGYWRRNKDHYVFNRPDAGAYNPAFGTSPSFHTTWVWGAGTEARVSTGELRWNASANFVADELKSTSLTHGHFNTRSYFKAMLAPERTWVLGGAGGSSGARKLTARAGILFDDTNRDGSAWSPVASLSLDGVSEHLGIESVYVSYADASQVPTYTALNSSASAGLFRGNPDLGRESARNIEVGARAGWGRVSASAAVFWRRDSDLVDWVYSMRLPNARVASAVDIDTMGFEAVVKYSSQWGDLVAGYTALSKDADYGASTTIDASFYALNYARHRVTAAIVVRPWSGWEVRLDNEARWQEANALRRSGDIALLTSAAVYYSPDFLRGVKVYAQMSNAWNDDFEEVPSVPAARRQWAVGLMATW